MTKQQRAKQLRYDKAYMRMAMEWAKLSYSQRKQVGAIMVKDRMINYEIGRASCRERV